MNYSFSDEVLEKPLIQNVKIDSYNNHTVLRWNWLDYTEVVLICIRISNVLTRETKEQIKLFTRDEYKKIAGFEFKPDEYGSTEIEVVGCKLENGVVTAYKQVDKSNICNIKFEKAKVYYDIKYNHNFLFNRGTKQATITIESDIYLPKDSLCYIKKAGELPINIDDGIYYALSDDIYPGKHELPTITINKKDFIKLFIADIDRFGDLCQLILR